MKKLVYFLLVLVVLSSCGEYQKVLNRGLNTDRYKLAEELYKEENYSKAIPLFEKLVGPYAGKPQMERIQFMIANSYFKTEDYTLSSYYFSKFITNYPKSTKAGEAAFLAAKSYFLASPKYSLDQQETQKALSAFQNFIDDYPNSKLSEEANTYFEKLTLRLEKKDFEVARQYYHTESYASAITAFDTFNEEHLGSKFKEDALYYKFLSSYELGVKSAFAKKKYRLENAKLAYNKFEKTYPESERMKELNSKLELIEEEILNTMDQTKKIINRYSKK